MSGILSGQRVLVVEDEMLVLMNIELALEELGCTCIIAAASVAEALSKLSDTSFDAAIIDVNLGGEKSYPIADRLAECGIPFAFSTGYGDHGDRADFADRPILRKPYVGSALEGVFDQLDLLPRIHAIGKLARRMETSDATRSIYRRADHWGAARA